LTAQLGKLISSLENQTNGFFVLMNFCSMFQSTMFTVQARVVYTLDLNRDSKSIEKPEKYVGQNKASEGKLSPLAAA
jgi:hypothetical protein